MENLYTELDLILCIKIGLQGHKNSANEFSAASLWEKGMTNDVPSRKNGRENTICKERQKVPLSPRQISSWGERVSGSLLRYLY